MRKAIFLSAPTSGDANCGAGGPPRPCPETRSAAATIAASATIADDHQ